MPMDAFTFLFRENEHGLFTVHAYPFERLADGNDERAGLGTFIVECREETWRAAGLDTADEATTIAALVGACVAIYLIRSLFRSRGKQ